MFKRSVIRKIAAMIMMAVFALSITPVVVFHNWLADHTDTVKKSSSKRGEHIGKQSFNCQCDHIVAESPFTEPGKTFATFFPQPSATIIVQPLVRFFESVQPVIALRGPPTV